MKTTEPALRDRVTPVAPAERILVLDVLRGFALLGIAIINMSGFKSADHSVAPEETFPGLLNLMASWLIDVFGSGKFNSIFSFLFGVGLTIQLSRAEVRQAPFVGLYLRRLAVLFGLGLIHLFLIWNGDVLHIYAALGLLLLVCRRLPDRFVVALIVLLLVIPMIYSGYRVYHQSAPHLTIAQREAKAAEEVQTFAHGTLNEMIDVRAASVRESFEQGWWFLFVSQMGVTLLLGFLAGRHRVFQNIPQYLPLIRRCFFWGLAIGLGCALFFATAHALRNPNQDRPTLLGLVTGIAYQLNRPVLSLVYMAAIVLLIETPGRHPWSAPLAAVGRMPLTNYLMQSILATTIFNSYGFGLYGQVGPAWGLVLSLAIYAVQVGYSAWWMAHFRFGPLEWLWRAATYGSFPQMTLDGPEPQSA